MTTVENITVTDGRMKRALQKRVEPFVQKEATKIVQKELDESLVRFGKITKFYPYLDKAEVMLNNSKKKMLCTILHRFGGDMIDLYTPAAYEKIFDDKLKEVAIIPKAQQNVCVLKVHDGDSVENLVLGYRRDKEIVGFNPANPGNVKLMSLNETNPYWIKFGPRGLECRLPSTPKISEGQLPKKMKDVDYADSSKVYTKEEVYTKEDVYTKEEVYTKKDVYTKEEVEDLIAQKIEEALQDNETNGDDDDDVTS